MVTVPHKFAASRHCETLSERARQLAAVNVMRRETDGRWSGDMTDGIALVAALRAQGFEPKGRRALVVGAGGAGSAVALALVEAGASVAVSEIDPGRRDDLRQRLAPSVAVGSGDPSGFDLVVNASPMGMAPDDPLPVDAARLAPGAFVADLVTKPAVTPLLDAAAPARLADPDRRGHVRAAGRDSGGFPVVFVRLRPGGRPLNLFRQPFRAAPGRLARIPRSTEFWLEIQSFDDIAPDPE